MNEKASCITINCGCCGNGDGIVSTGTLKYAQLEVTSQVIKKDQKIYFNEHSFGNMEITKSGSVVIPPGVYRFFMNFFIYDAETPTSCFAALRIYDMTNDRIIGKPCGRASSNYSNKSSSSECSVLLKVEEEVEICLVGDTEGGSPYGGNVYANIVEIPTATGTV